MSPKLDHALLEFSLGELPVMRRLDVRLRLAFSPAGRRRLAELQKATSAIAGTLGKGGIAAFEANSRIKLRRLLFVDLAISAILLTTIALGVGAVVRTIRGTGPEACPPNMSLAPVSAPVVPPHHSRGVYLPR